MDDKRYADLPRTTRAFLEGLGEQDIVMLADAVWFYRKLPREAREFLQRAKPRTMEWLTDARPEEIDQLAEGIELVQSSRTVGRFLKWTSIAIVTVFAGTWALGEHIINFLRGALGK